MAGIGTNTQYNQIRRDLEARSLYNPENPYTINNNNVVKAINSIAGLIPGKSINITNTIIGRAFLTNQTPIMTIGLQQYAKHLAQSVTSYGISDIIPSVNVRNLFDGNPNTKLITKKEDYRITRDETKTTVGRILEDITNQQPRLSNSIFTNRGNLAPFDKLPNQFDYIRNTGKGQLNQYYANIGRNLYVQTSEDFIEAASNQGYKVDKVTKALLNKSYFPTTDYSNFPEGQAASDEVRSEIVLFREESTQDRISEYGSEITTLGMGRSKINPFQNVAQNQPNQELSIDFEFDENDYGFNENINNQIVWGRDDDLRRFGVRSGALLYTKGLLQAKGNKAYFDQTKKKFTINGEQHYNGSPLTRDLNGQVLRIRQHNILDPYNNYGKAIRFTGNTIYNAPVESVINKTIIPKMHPIIDNSKNINNRNMMFSIENLAYVLNDKGYLGDSLGTKVPQSEVGFNRGRLMWFAPYDVEVNETASAKYETTQFIGRSEPIYSYQTSERSARLSFKLIVDYPPQIDGQSHGDIAKFFAFGGNFSERKKNVDIDKLKAEKVKLENELSTIQPEEKLLPPPDLQTGRKINFYFDNDVRSVDVTLDSGYEDGIKTPNEQTEFSLNVSFISQVNSVIDILTSNINETPAYNFYKIKFVGSASKLYNNLDKQAAYNEQLGRDRATSLKNYVEKKFREVIGKDFNGVGLSVSIVTEGSIEGSAVGATVAGIPLKIVKEERSAWCILEPSGFVDKKPIKLTTEQLERKKKIIEDIQAIDNEINSATKVQNDERLFNTINIGDRAMKGFEAMKKITLSPVFHSQTPEDFHRRLTFLHQCTRQGNSVIDSTTREQGIPTATNSVFGRPPICILRLGDMFHSKVIIETVDFDYSESIWDINPEGMGMQFMIADITISMKIIGGQSLKSAIDVIQNAESFNYYANSTYYKNDVYKSASAVEAAQTVGDTDLISATGQVRAGNRFGALQGSDDATQFNKLPITPAV